jgi:hypothetical protein
MCRWAETTLGILLALTPVLLWAAWTPSLALAVLGLAIVSAALLAFLDRSGGDHGGPPAAPKPALTDECIDEVHRLFPLVYHHSRYETPAFRRAMEKLRRLLT